MGFFQRQKVQYPCYFVSFTLTVACIFCEPLEILFEKVVFDKRYSDLR